MISEDWAQIGRLHRAEGLRIRAIARHMGVTRKYGCEGLPAEGTSPVDVIDVIPNSVPAALATMRVSSP